MIGLPRNLEIPAWITATGMTTASPITVLIS
jgi:hypothetical protein